jgi:signal transduction histidine kinase
MPTAGRARHGRHDHGAAPAVRLGQPAHVMERRRGELLALTYLLGDVGVLGAWAANPHDVTNEAGVVTLVTFVFVAAATMFVLRHKLPVWVGDLAILGSLVLIDLANLFTRLDVYPAVLMPYYIWVGFTSPLWFPRRRAILYIALTAAASGLVVIIGHSDAAVAVWLVTMITLVVAFIIVSFLTDALARSERLAAVGEMASAVSHDLRTPLTAVTNALYLIQKGITDEQAVELKRHFDMADNQIAKAAAIAQHLVDFVRPHEPRLEDVDLAQLVADVIEAVPPPAAVTVSVDCAPARLAADNAQLTQVVTNLVTNAYEAMGDGGALRLTVRTDAMAAVITVADSGPGLDKDVVDMMFEPFFTTKHSGTGLGLAIVRRMTEAHGGTVTVDSRPGHGTRFVIRLPLVAPNRTDTGN